MVFSTIHHGIIVATVAVFLIVSHGTIEAKPASSYFANDADVDIAKVAVARAVDDQLSRLKDLLDEYFAETASTASLSKRAVRLLRLGK
uniref:RxLR effector protein n=1 Tax=Mesocestoides corti TaxID=53468 RepID=A0A5K3FYR5_MESCO